MANLHNLFNEYNRNIRLSDLKRNQLIQARNGLRARIESRLGMAKEKFTVDEQLEFQSQGSYVMDTIITPVHEDYDLDDGVYFIGNCTPKQRPETDVFHRLVIEAIGINYHEVVKVIDKSTCVRIIFKSGFHIDLPIYYAGNKECPDLADKNRGWILSNPVEFIAWFEEKIKSGFKKEFLYESLAYGTQYERWLTDIRKQDHQLRRIVRYLKSWGDLHREEMPCGLVMTILAANSYSPHERDDIALKETLVLIHSCLSKSFKCERPTTPEGEDLLKDYKNQDAFIKYLQYFIDNAKQGLMENDGKKACAYWQKSLGDRFPCHLAMETNDSAAVLTGLIKGVSTSRPWAREN
jgi:hypothetical protein